MKVIIVGGVAGGASCAARLRRLDEKAEILMVERGPYVSYANCGLPYHVSGVIPEESSLLVATEQTFRAVFNVEVRTSCEAVAIDPKRKTVDLRDVKTGKVTTESYDKLVLSPGAAPIRPPLPGIDLPGIFSVRTVPDARTIREWLHRGEEGKTGLDSYTGFQVVTKPKRAVVVGGGFIGLEMVENLAHLGLEVTLVEKLNQVMPPLDPEMSRLVEVESLPGALNIPPPQLRARLGELPRAAVEEDHHGQASRSDRAAVVRPADRVGWSEPGKTRRAAEHRRRTCRPSKGEVMTRQTRGSVLAVAVLVVAVGTAAGAQELQQKLAAAKENAAQNQQALRSYGWIEKVELSLKGEVKSSAVNSCRYGADGKVQKTPVVEPPPPQKKRGLRGKAIAKKTGEMKAELEAAVALVHQYVPPDPGKMQVVINAGTASLAQAGPGVLVLKFAGYEKQGDALSLTFDSAVKALRLIDVATHLDSPQSPVTLRVALESLPDGPRYPGNVVLSMPASKIEVRIANSNYQKLAP